MNKQKRKTYRDGITDLLLAQGFILVYGYFAYEILAKIFG